MQEAAFNKWGIKAYYLDVELDATHFRKAMRGLSRLALDGFNVTVPYKRVVIPYLDQLTPEARAIGAVNTVFRKGGRWIGLNTDCDGFLTSLREDGRFFPRGKNVLVLGGGGSARAAVYALARSGAGEILIANRHPLKAERIIRDFRNLFPKTSFKALTLHRSDLKKGIEAVHLVINATSVGLKANDVSIISPSLIPPVGKRRLLFFDFIYHRKLTPFLKGAKAKGHRTVDGLGMLLYQGALAFEYWTHRKAPLPVMRQALLQATKEQA